MPATYKIDPQHSSANFVVRHMMITNVRGGFSKVQGTVVWDPSALNQSSVEATVDAASIDTREPDRDKHLRSADFFDVEKFPALTFLSTGFERDGDGELKIAGILTIHGVSKAWSCSQSMDRRLRAKQNPLRQRPHRRLGHHQNQAQRFRSHHGTQRSKPEAFWWATISKSRSKSR